MAHTLTKPQPNRQAPAFSNTVPSRVSLTSILSPLLSNGPSVVTPGIPFALRVRLLKNWEPILGFTPDWTFSVDASLGSIGLPLTDQSGQSVPLSEQRLLLVPADSTATSICIGASCEHPSYGSSISNPLFLTIVPAPKPETSATPA